MCIDRLNIPPSTGGYSHVVSNSDVETGMGTATTPT